MRDTARIAIGSRLLRDGEMCEVIALEAAEAVVIGRHGSAARVRIADLLRPAGQAGPGLAGAAGGQAPAGEPAGVLLGAAGDDALADARQRAGHVREVLSGPAARGGAAYRALDELSRGRGSFTGSAKGRRSIAGRPSARDCWRRCPATRGRTCSAGGRTASSTRSSTSANWRRSSGNGSPHAFPTF
ncbi:MAG TPA: hypothetical protein VIY52_26835 [Streptosporangiaceae bacterium]